MERQRARAQRPRLRARTRHCEVCGTRLPKGTRLNKRTCSDRCRKRKQRQQKSHFA
ncbi:MAG: DUF2116 family Zn-ribbon domain-containing protein [Chloroflexi bacterium]|uniref:DUF2116 family Zn-ribbon domain-containing protein n=1 Tax=Candidatus Flexifilum breve TaxID=3140694 RepID=UPI0031376629|nr:DUF2116 family Zn-ribbon domain-containing protein [Chloroflexota bacterium]